LKAEQTVAGAAAEPPGAAQDQRDLSPAQWLQALNVQQHRADATARAPRTLLLAHGYGCDQTMWRALLPLLLQQHHCITFDFPGTGAGSPLLYDPLRHASLDGYADTVLGLVRALAAQATVHGQGAGGSGLVFVGHSVSAMVGALAAVREPQAFAELVMLCPSPCYRNDGPGYAGGFEPADLQALLDGLAAGHLAWAEAVAPAIMGNPDRPALAAELADRFCQMDPTIALRWARATFLTDLRPLVPQVPVPTVVLQCREDAIAPPQVGQWTAERLPRGRLAWLEASGHCPQLSHPQEVARVLLGALGTP